MLVAVVNRLNTNNPEIQKFSEPEIRDPALFMRTGVGYLHRSVATSQATNARAGSRAGKKAAPFLGPQFKEAFGGMLRNGVEGCCRSETSGKGQWGENNDGRRTNSRAASFIGL